MKVTIHNVATGEVWEEEQDDALFDTTDLDDAMKRNERNALLSNCDWTQAGDDPTGNKEAWATYRQQLRDLPADPAWPYVDFPEPPADNGS